MRVFLLVTLLLAGAPQRPPLVVTQRSADGLLRLLLLRGDGSTTLLSRNFAEAADPDVSWDAKTILFAGRKTAADKWQIYEMPAQGGAARRVVSAPFDCRSPIYQSTVYVITADQPWRQIAFVANGALYSSRLDGSDIQKLTYHSAPDSSPRMLPDGRMVFSSRGGLYAVNADGTDFAEFSVHEGAADKRNPVVTADGRVVFDEPDGAAAVSLRRNLHSYSKIARTERVPAGYLQAIELAPRPEPDGSRRRSPEVTAAPFPGRVTSNRTPSPRLARRPCATCSSSCRCCFRPPSTH